MQELILKNNISPSKMEALIYFLKSWDIEVEIKHNTEVSSKKKSDFSLAAGLWKDHTIDANELRKKAWSRSL
ncbi:hypothetical protein ABIB40_003456 [Pedobacter sp. UYP30]|uniref:hypothetical protein n=1 Tax=Pedobacter sp. UYP30 TaxID=1756400 RepID=UPI0033974F74